MDMQALIDAIGTASAETRKNYHLSLGGLIEAVAALAEETPVQFDIGGGPSGPHSYRGYYSDLAFERTAQPVTAGRFLAGLQNCLGQSFEGYKGGDFTMQLDTPVWQASSGSTGRAVIAASLIDGALILTTKDI